MLVGIAVGYSYTNTGFKAPWFANDDGTFNTSINTYAAYPIDATNATQFTGKNVANGVVGLNANGNININGGWTSPLIIKQSGGYYNISNDAAAYVWFSCPPNTGYWTTLMMDPIIDTSQQTYSQIQTQNSILAGTNISIAKNANGSITITSSGGGSGGGNVTSVTATSPLYSSGGVNPDISLTGVISNTNIPNLVNKTISINTSSPLALLDVRRLTPTTGLGQVQGMKIDISDDGGTNNPASGDYVGIYSRIESDVTKNRVWGLNTQTDLPAAATAWGIESSVNNAFGDSLTFGVTNHVLGINTASGGTYHPTAAYSTDATNLTTNGWQYGLYLKGIGDSAGSALIKSDSTNTVGYGLDLLNGTFSAAPIRIPNNKSIVARNAANTNEYTLITLNPSDNVVIGQGSAGIVLFTPTTFNTLSGSGNAYACLDSAGTLYRSATSCVP